MPAITASAPGKIILFGEHAVVYGRPAVAVPVNQVRARAIVTANPGSAPGTVRIQAPDVGLEAELASLSEDHPLALAARLVLSELGVARPPACTLRITSSIPLSAGMGSGAAVSVALIRALSAFLGQTLSDERVSALAYEVEKLYHGTPSGIDNTVITYALPVYFVRGQPVETLHLPSPFMMVVGDTGLASPTAIAVGDLRRAWQSEPARYELLFDGVGQIAQAARAAIEAGQPQALGALMDENHALLRQMGVSCAELDHLVEAARAAGASGAKLSGAGRGGNMIALVQPENAQAVARALERAGARRALITLVQKDEPVRGG
ncbi:MAG: mevalonate kinase [Chloroflexota bacterium]